MKRLRLLLGGVVATVPAAAATGFTWWSARTLLRPPRYGEFETAGNVGQLPFAYTWPTARPMQVIGPWPYDAPAAPLGPLEPRDVIEAIDGERIDWNAWQRIQPRLRRAGVGAPVHLRVRRDRGSGPLAFEATVELAHDVVLPSDIGLAYREIEISTARGILRGWHLPCGRLDAPVIVAGHGMAATRHAMLVGFAKALVGWGYDVVLWDALAHGTSGGVHVDLVGRAEMDAAVRWVREMLGSTRRIGLMGHSYGGVKVLAAAAARRDIEAVVALASPRTVTEGIEVVGSLFMGVPIQLIKALMPLLSFWVRIYTGAWLGEADALAAIRRLDCPVLIAQGEWDELWPLSTAQALFDASPGPKELVVVPGVDHNSLLVAGPPLLGPLRAFLRDSLGGL